MEKPPVNILRCCIRKRRQKRKELSLSERKRKEIERLRIANIGHFSNRRLQSILEFFLIAIFHMLDYFSDAHRCLILNLEKQTIAHHSFDH